MYGSVFLESPLGGVAKGEAGKLTINRPQPQTQWPWLRLRLLSYKGRRGRAGRFPKIPMAES